MIRRARALLRRARYTPVFGTIVRAADRYWWARTIRRARVVDPQLARAQRLPRSERAAIRAYVRGGFRRGMVLNPLIQERLVASQLSDVGRVPALYAYLVNETHRVETSVSWDSRSAAGEQGAQSDPGGPLGFAWRRAREDGRIDLRGTVVAWDDLESATTEAARRAHVEEAVSVTLRANNLFICRIADDEDAALPLRLADELLQDSDLDVVLALGRNADHWVAGALLTLRHANLHLTRDDSALAAKLATSRTAGWIGQRGPHAEISADDIRRLAVVAAQRSIARPLWLDLADGTIVSSGVAFRQGVAFDLLAGHPSEDAAAIEPRFSAPAGRGDTFVRTFEGTDDTIVCTDIVVRAPAQPLPTFAAQPDTDLTGFETLSGFSVAEGPGPAPCLIRRPQTFTLPDGFEVPRLRWAIKTAAPAGPRGEWWGDTHFARGIADALRRLGQEVVIDSYAARDRPSAYLDDVVLALRGPEPIVAQPGATSILWIISHPDEIAESEVAGFDILCAASEPWAHGMTRRFGREIVPLLQCTDQHRFQPHGLPHNSGLLFVGTARGIPRPSIIEPLRAGIDISVYGPDWSGWIPGTAIKGAGVPNAKLPEMYESAAAVLNDHWPAMRDAGFVSNRLFDVVAAGGRAISDHVEGIDSLFEGAVLTYRSIPDLLDILRQDFTEKLPSEEELQRISERVRTEHSFDARARELLSLAGLR